MEEEQLPLPIPQTILQPLYTASNSTNLHQTLETLTHLSKTPQNRTNLASQNILPPLLILIQSLPPNSHYLFPSLKLLRNLCAGEFSNQNSFIHRNGIKIISSLLSCNNTNHGVLRIGLQVVGNVALAGEEHQRVIWEELFPNGFMEIAKIRRKEVCDVLCMIIYACIDGCEELSLELFGDRGLVVMVEIIRTVSEVGYVEDWLRLLLSRLCLEDFLCPFLFSKLYLDDASENCKDSKSSGDVFSSEQVFLLRTVSEILNERLKQITVPNDFATWILGIFRKAVEAVDFDSRGTSGLPTELTVVDVLGYSLIILRDIGAQGRSKEQGSVDVVDSLVSSGLLELLLSLLHDLEPPAIIRKAMKQSDSQEGSVSSKVCPYKGFRRDIVGVIGNCAFGKKHVQDEIRAKNAILLLLQQCVLDEENPFLREWGIWSVRNLLEGNVENEKEVAELELQGSVDVSELSGLGIRVEVDKQTRKAKLVNVP